MTEPKLCKDCEYSKYINSFGWRMSNCLRPREMIGFPDFNSSCWFERNMNSLCGAEAKYYKTRRPWWKRLLGIE